MRWSEFPWCGNIRDKSQKCFGPGTSDFPKLSVTALLWWAKGRRPLGPPKVRRSAQCRLTCELHVDDHSFPFTFLSLIYWSCRGDFNISTLDFTSWSSYLGFGFFCVVLICDLPALILDVTLMNLLSAWCVWLGHLAAFTLYIQILHFAFSSYDVCCLCTHRVTLHIRLYLTCHLGSDHDWLLTCYVQFAPDNFESNLYSWHCILHFTLIPWHDIVAMKCMSRLYVGIWLHMPSSPQSHVICLF